MNGFKRADSFEVETVNQSTWVVDDKTANNAGSQEGMKNVQCTSN